MYRRLNGSHVTETLERLRRRIEERFPDSGLSGVARELLDVSQQVQGQLYWHARI